MLDYSEYKSIVEILGKSDLDNTYKDLIKKEEKVLDTVNTVVNYYKDRKAHHKQIIHMSLYEIYTLFFLEWPALLVDLYKVKTPSDVQKVLMKNNRPIYLGILMVMLSIIFFFVESSK